LHGGHRRRGKRRSKGGKGRWVVEVAADRGCLWATALATGERICVASEVIRCTGLVVLKQKIKGLALAGDAAECCVDEVVHGRFKIFHNATALHSRGGVLILLPKYLVVLSLWLLSQDCMPGVRCKGICGSRLAALLLRVPAVTGVIGWARFALLPCLRFPGAVKACLIRVVAFV
jgi:hypothetical protein